MGKPTITKSLIARCAPGLEQMVVGELQALGFSSAKHVRPGRVALSKEQSSRRAVMMSNLWLRTANRVTLEVGRFKALDFGTLYNGARSVQWRKHIDIEKNLVVVKASSAKSKLYHSAAIEERVADAIKSSIGEAYDPITTTTVYAEMEKDTCVLSIDTTGEPLEQRGWRSPGEAVKAPLKATAAAALLKFAGWPKSEEVLGDPFAGSGTIVMEAAAMSLGVAPGLRRAFAFEAFPQFDREEWEKMVEKGSRRRRDSKKIVARGTDRDRGAVEIARRAAKEGGLDDVVQFDIKPVTTAFEDDPRPTCVVTNPPHFRRLTSKNDPRDLYASMGAMLKNMLKTGTPCTFLLANPPNLLMKKGRATTNMQLLGQLGFPTKNVTVFSNGGNETYVYTGQSA